MNAPISIHACRGVTGECPHALGGTKDLAAGIDGLLAAGGPGSAGTAGQPSAAAHLRFSIGIAACPNACSRPQIMDVGFIRTEYPEMVPDRCTGCGACVTACREGCLSLKDSCIAFASASCVGCGDCRKACPSDAIRAAREGFRVLVGGRLGRHPRLATELPGLYTAAGACERLAACLNALKSARTPGVRLAALLDAGDPGLKRSLGL